MIPVITIDGPSGCGKGTMAQRLAQHLGWHLLDSGALYRVIAWAVLHYQLSLDDDKSLRQRLERLKIQLNSRQTDAMTQAICDDHDVSQAIRTEECANMASQLSKKPFIRELLQDRQRAVRQPPGLVADGRDMGTVIFPDALLKLFLTASEEERAHRRYNQLKTMGINASLEGIRQDLNSRDQRDRQRAVAPLQPAADAVIIDSTDLTINQVFAVVLEHVKGKEITY